MLNRRTLWYNIQNIVVSYHESVNYDIRNDTFLDLPEEQREIVMEEITMMGDPMKMEKILTGIFLGGL